MKREESDHRRKEREPGRDPQQGRRSRQKRSTRADTRSALLFAQALLIFLTLLIYSQVYGFGFIDLDDNVYISENPIVQQGVTLQGMRWAFTTFETGNWHPLTWISLMFDAELFTHPGGPHMVNVFLHLFNTLILLRVLKHLTGDLWRSALVAALFAVHPLHVESVAWVAERKDVLSTMFGLLSIGAYVRYVDKDHDRKWFATSFVFLALGLMAKPMLVTIPVVLLLLDLWPLGRWASTEHRSFPWPTWSLLREKLPMVVIVAASAAVAIIAQNAGKALVTLDDLSVFQRSTNALVAYVKYLGAFFWPSELAVLYPLSMQALPWWYWSASLGTLALITVIVIRWWRRSPYLVMGWFWYLVTLLPVIGLVQVGAQSLADRYTYIPSIGIFVMVGWGVPELADRLRWPRRNINIGFVTAILLLSLVSWKQVGFWRNSRTLFEHTLASTGANPLIEFNYGVILAVEGRHQEAIAHFGNGLEAMPEHFVALVDMGISLAALGELDKAMDYYRRAAAVDPGVVELKLKMSTVLGQQGKDAEAIGLLLEAIELDTNGSAILHSNLGFLYLRQQNTDAAMEHLVKATHLDPSNAQAQNNLGLAHASVARYAEAVVCFKRALQIDPGYANASQNLDRALAALEQASVVGGSVGEP